jgi:hypothetical protein
MRLRTPIFEKKYTSNYFEEPSRGPFDKQPKPIKKLFGESNFKILTKFLQKGATIYTTKLVSLVECPYVATRSKKNIIIAYVNIIHTII